MQRITFFLFGLLAVASIALTASPIFAASGACSSHGGVNCSAGSDYDGSVICYDGWRNSTVSYSSMSMCSGNTYTPSSYSPDVNCMLQFGIHAKASATTGYCSCESGYIFNTDDQCVKDPREEELKLIRAIQTQGGVLEGELSTSICPTFSDREQSRACKCRPGFFAVLNTCVTVQSYCTARQGEASEWNFFERSCTCKNGFILDPLVNTCRSLFEVCKERLGPLAAVDMPTQCKCAQGASIDPVTKKCESNAVLEKQRAQAAPPVATVVEVSIPVQAPATISTAQTPSTPKASVAPKKFATTPTRVNVRALPSTTAKALGTTKVKTPYEVLEQKNGWVKVLFGTKTGWITAKLVVIK